MKRIFWGLAALPLLATLATSCANETVEKKGDAFLSYKPVTGKQTATTRAAEIDVTSILGEDLTVWVYETDGGDYYATHTLTYGGSDWTYNNDNPIFHPAMGLTHYSVHPASALTDDVGYDPTVDEPTSFDYAATGGTDLIVADVVATTNASENDATANMVYRHLLSQINFAITTLEDVDISVTNIAVNGVLTEDVYSFTAGTPDWTGAPTTPAIVPIAYPADGDIPAAAGLITPGTVNQLKNATNALMLMPQEFVQGTNDANFTFDFVLTDPNNDDEVIDQGSATVYFYDLAFGASTTWQRGKKYTYVINFEAPYKLTYTVTEDPWVVGSDNLPVDVDNANDGDENSNGSVIIPDRS